MSGAALGQPKRPYGLTEAEYQRAKRALKAKVRRLEAAYALYDEESQGFRGVWTVAGTRSAESSDGDVTSAALTGELTITYDREEERYEVAGKVKVAGQRGSRWDGVADLGSGQLIEAYDAVAGGEGEALYTRAADGTLALRFRSLRGEPKITARASLTPAFAVSQAELRQQLFEAKKELQYLRYPRPEPVRYAARSGDVALRFTPTVEHDPDGVEEDVLRLIKSAKASIDVASFEFALVRVSRALIEAQQRGVKVRVVYDDLEDHQRAVQLLKQHQVPCRSDGRSGFMHNKFMVIDRGQPEGDLVWTGSTNLAPRGIYVSDNHTLLFHNAELAKLYTIEFEEMFVDGQFGITSPSNTSHEWIRVDRFTKVQVYFAPEDDALDRLIELVKTARRSIKIIAFAFTSPRLFKAITERMAAGVEVQGLFESRHAGWKDIMIAPLHNAGADVRFDRNPDALHHKVIVIDGRYVCTGSFNFSDNADRTNDENMVIVNSRSVARVFTRELAQLFSVSDPNDPRIATAGMPDPNDDPDGILDAIRAARPQPAATTPTTGATPDPADTGDTSGLSGAVDDAARSDDD
ncbi:MAG TPA: hypothetical protein DEA08_35570 [Planctomycetes bacterium]|nr:hypothetical protein [Planctomycetota bacterium]